MNMTLKELRIKAVLSQRDLSKLSGVAGSTILYLEQNKCKPRFVTIRKTCEALGVEPSAIEW